MRTITDNQNRVWEYDDAEGTWQHGEFLIGCGFKNVYKWMRWGGPDRYPEEFKTLRQAMANCR